MTIFIVILGISVIILLHELGHFLAAKSFGLLVEEFGFGFPPRLFSKKIGETTYSFNLLPFGGFVKIYGENREALRQAQGEPAKERSFAHQPFYKKTAVILAGVATNFILGWLIISAIFIMGSRQIVAVTEVLKNSPAEAAGLQAGDVLVDFKTSEEFLKFVRENQGGKISLKTARDGDELVFELTPRINPPAGEGAIGVAFAEAGLPKYSFFRSFWEGLKASVAVSVAIVVSLFQLLIGLFTEGRLAANFVGPIGIFGVANQAAGLGFAFLLQLIGLISLNLFVLNILPFPALDGGRFLFAVIEKIKKSPLSLKFEQSANALGFLILILLMIAITVRDVVRLF